MKLCAFIRPASLSAAHENLRELGREGMILAGGTALHFMQDHTPVTAVDIMSLGLSFIREEGDYYNIGATTSLADIQRYRAPRWAMHEICRRISTHQIRNISTIGGNICRVFPWADLPVILLAMDARMVIYTGSDEEEFPADEYFKEQPAKRFLDGNILTSGKIPQLKAHHGVGSIKVGRAEAAFAQVTIAALLELDGSTIKTARVAAGGAIPFPRRLPSVEAALGGQQANEETFKEAAAQADADVTWRGREGMTPEYSRHLAEVTIYDALERAAAFARVRNE